MKTIAEIITPIMIIIALNNDYYRSSNSIHKFSGIYYELRIFRTQKEFRIGYDSQPIPSLSPSNLWGSGCNTVNRFCGISLQSKSGGLDGMQKSG